MKYFDKLSAAVQAAFSVRAVDTDKLLYCVKADMDGEGCYYDTYITFDNKTLYLLSGYDRLVKNKKTFDTQFDFKDFSEYPMEEIEKLYVDRYQFTARLMAKMTDGTEKQLAMFSGGFSEKFEQFCRRYETIKKGETPDDSALDDKTLYCPKCNRKYPDPNRAFCPYCTKRTWVFKRLLGMFGEAAFSLLSTGFSMIYGVIISRITPQVIHKLRTDIFASMQKLSLSFFTTKQTGSLMGRVDRDSFDVYGFFVDIVPQFIANMIKIAGLVVLMLMVNPIISLSMFLAVFFVLLCEVLWLRGQRRHWRNRDIARRGVTSTLSDALNGHRVVKAFSREEQEISRFGRKNNNLYSAEYARDKRSAHFFPVQHGIYAVFSGVIYCLGVALVLMGNLQLGGLTLLINYFGVIWDPIFFFMYMGNDWARCTDAAGRMFEILDSEPTVKPPAEPAVIPDGVLKGDIRFKDVTFEYEAGRPVLKNMSFATEAGRFTGIVGKTGAGKSTIINLISRMYDVTSGEITIDGIPVKKIPFDVLRKNIGVVSQETYLFMGTVADNIRYARPDATMEEVIQAAKSANAHDFIMKLPEGYDTVTGSGGVSLSGGEKQRISIARALIQKPNILILDEATAAMDTATERKIQSAIDNLKSGRTIIAIAHRLSTLRDADKLYVIEHGEVKESGTHDELIRTNGKYFELYKLQSESLKSVGLD
ncbi:MAG: ATP-binding cassette domain-containing protein [[Eubacterium] siraeum]|nr:ATP-binding cassette domain-containing protein [[Eubacterium] siraeum]